MLVLHRLLTVVGWSIATTISAGLVFFLGSGFALLVTMQLDPHSVRPTTAIQVDRYSLSLIGQTTLIYAVEHRENLPRADTIWEYAALLADRSGLDEAEFWQTQNLRPKPMTVLLPGPRGERSINPEFLAKTPTIAVPKGTLTLDMPATTPIAWTAGLRQDGTWTTVSAYGGDGGLICFLAGNVVHYPHLHENGGALFHFATGEKTSNILDALPPGTTILEAPHAGLRKDFGRKRLVESLRSLIEVGWFVWLILVFAPVNFLLLCAFGLHARRLPKWLLLLPVGWALALVLSMFVMRQL